MRIGITCTLQGLAPQSTGAPDDAEEEFDKPETVEAVAGVLRNLGHAVEVLGDGPALVRRLLDDPPQFVFNFAEGTGVSRSRESRVPAVLEMLDIPFSGSDPLALAATLDKDCAKRLVQSVGVRTPRWVMASERWSAVSDRLQRARLEFPLIVKPAYEGSSKGIRLRSLVNSAAELERVLGELAADYKQPVLVEEFIAGDEVTVAVVGNAPPRVVGAMRVLPTEPTDRFVYSIEVKRDWRRRVRYESPAKLPAQVIEKLHQSALAAYEVFGCRDVCRIDFRVRGGEPYFLEANPLPGLSPETGDIVLLARGHDMNYPQLIETIFRSACQRYGL
jgi:D-alanine-D-alanine ligase